MPLPVMKTLPRDPALVVFDLDGTLVDAYQAITESVNVMLKTLGLPLQAHRTVKRSVGWGVDTLMRCFVPEEKAAEALVLFRAHHDTRLRDNVRLLPGVRTLLPFLRERGCCLAIASNRPTQFCHIILKSAGIDQYFDQVICGDAVKNPKPAPDMVREILKRTRISPKRAVFVGDMSVDVLCARAAGVFSVAVPTGSCTRREIRQAGPDLFLERISGIRQLFKTGTH